MKSLLFSLALALSAGQVFSQKNAVQSANQPDAQARSATEKLTTKYALNADQAKQVYQIQTRKFRNLAQIEALRASEPAKFEAELRSVRQSTAANFRRVLRTKEQVAIFKKTEAANRAHVAAARKKQAVGTAAQAPDFEE